VTEYHQFLDWFLHANTHVVSAISDDQNRVEIVSTRTRAFRKPRIFTSLLSVNFRATDANRDAFQVGDQLLLETIQGHAKTITIRPKNGRLPSFTGIWTEGKNANPCNRF
jgi:hypothetical protein